MAAVLGGVLGWDRERKNRPAGLRTHMLVALSSALFVVVGDLSLDRAPESDQRLEFDPLRVLQAVGKRTHGVARGKPSRGARAPGDLAEHPLRAACAAP